MVLDDQNMTNLFFSSIPHAAISYLEAHPREHMPRRFRSLLEVSWLWNLEITAMESHPRSYVYDADRGLWSLNKVNLCPSGLCECLGQDTKGFLSWYMCESCKAQFEYWTAFFSTALLAITLNFAEEEEPKKPLIMVEHETRRRKQDHESQKANRVHTYQTITFDLAVKPLAPSPQGIHQKEKIHPTWVERAIQDETILYVDKCIDESQRTFRHERYVNMRGKTITIPSYSKRIPRSVKRLKQTIHQAIASTEKSS